MKKKRYIPKYHIMDGAPEHDACCAACKLKTARYAGQKKEAFYAP